jgi:hypothetical protein
VKICNAGKQFDNNMDTGKTLEGRASGGWLVGKKEIGSIKSLLLKQDHSVWVQEKSKILESSDLNNSERRIAQRIQ